MLENTAIIQDVVALGTITAGSGSGNTVVLQLVGSAINWSVQLTSGPFSSGTTLVFEGSMTGGASYDVALTVKKMGDVQAYAVATLPGTGATRPMARSA